MINDVPIFIIWIGNGGRIKNMWMILNFRFYGFFFVGIFYECSWRLYEEVGGRRWRNGKNQVLMIHWMIQ